MRGCWGPRRTEGAIATGPTVCSSENHVVSSLVVFLRGAREPEKCTLPACRQPGKGHRKPRGRQQKFSCIPTQRGVMYPHGERGVETGRCSERNGSYRCCCWWFLETGGRCPHRHTNYKFFFLCSPPRLSPLSCWASLRVLGIGNARKREKQNLLTASPHGAPTRGTQTGPGGSQAAKAISCGGPGAGAVSVTGADSPLVPAPRMGRRAGTPSLWPGVLPGGRLCCVSSGDPAPHRTPHVGRERMQMGVLRPASLSGLTAGSARVARASVGWAERPRAQPLLEKPFQNIILETKCNLKTTSR